MFMQVSDSTVAGTHMAAVDEPRVMAAVLQYAVIDGCGSAAVALYKSGV